MKKTDKYKYTRLACYCSGVAMAATVNLSPLLFVTFRNLYGISYTMLGFLVVLNFSAQLIMDLMFSFFTKYFNIALTTRLMPIINLVGLVVFALIPALFPQYAYAGIILGTLCFSVASGLCEVLTSPVMAALPSDNPERDMSILHSVYAWGTVGVVIVCTLFLRIAGSENWYYLALIMAIIPLVTAIMFFCSSLPPMDTSSNAEKYPDRKNRYGIFLCVMCIFFGGAAECTMSQWASGFMENAVGIPKVWGDILGMALFAFLLGLGRSLYGKYGKDISKVIMWSMLASAVCYAVASVSISPMISLIACAMSGLTTAMLWPGTIIYTGSKFTSAGVGVYALLAAGGDCGASVAPQLVGYITDAVGSTDFAVRLGNLMSVTAEQIGMRAGMLSAAFFPFAGFFLFLYMEKYFSNY